MKLIDDLRGLDRNNVGGWPMPVKIFFCAMVFTLLLALGWYLMVKPKQEELEGLVANEQTLRTQFVDRQGRAAYYAEKPISLKLRGTYHQFGNFISGVAALPRVVILTLHDVSLTPAVAAGSKSTQGVKQGELFLEGTVKTYRYLEDDEVAALTPPTPGTPPPPPPPPAGGH